MKYFLFNEGFPYYAVIVADNEESAFEEYIEVVSDIDEDDMEWYTTELSTEEVIIEIKKAKFESEVDRDEMLSRVEVGIFDEHEVLLIATDLIGG